MISGLATLPNKCQLKLVIEVMLHDDLRKSRIDTALEIFIDKKQLVASNADVIRREYVDLCSKKSVSSKLTEFNCDRDRLDTLLSDILEKEKAGNGLITFVQQMLTIFHGNAAVERSFSINKECLVENLLQDSLIAHRVVYDAVSAVGGVSNIQITKPMIHSVRNASAKRLEAAKKKITEEDAAANKRKRIIDEIKQLESKKARIEQSAKDETSSLNEELKSLRNSLKN
jgi:hypothetical protein